MGDNNMGRRKAQWMKSNNDKGSGRILRHNAGGAFEFLSDDFAIEEPLSIRVGRKTLATTMRTPDHDEELAAGFLLSDGTLGPNDKIDRFSHPITGANRENIIVVKPARGTKLKRGGVLRLGTITSSCGMCGNPSIDAMWQRFPPIKPRDVRIDIPTLLSLPDQLRKEQDAFSLTGGIHAAGIFEMKGKLVIAREDIGRHNAVDKTIGRAFLDGLLPLDRHLLLVSGRASFEIVQKALAAGIPIVAAVSAASNLAVSFAREMNQTLIGFLRPPSFNIYSHVERVILEE
jgi:FdhD protein